MACGPLAKAGDLMDMLYSLRQVAEAQQQQGRMTFMQLTAPIVHVTVFPDRARIERSGDITLEAGNHSLTIGGLPAALDRDSVRASGSGPAGTRIERIDIASEYHAEAPEAE